VPPIGVRESSQSTSSPIAVILLVAHPLSSLKHSACQIPLISIVGRQIAPKLLLSQCLCQNTRIASSLSAERSPLKEWDTGL